MTIVFSGTHQMKVAQLKETVIFQISIRKNNEWLKSEIFTLSEEKFKMFLEHYHDELGGLDG